jgi:predicted nucleic acid-binding protein
MRYLWDTTFVIDHLRNDAGAMTAMERMLVDGDVMFINEIVAGEAWAGARAAEARYVRNLLNLPVLVQPGPGAAERAGAWRKDARARGWTLSLTDALIAAAADACDATILTRNGRDFALTPVPVESY